MVFGVALMLLHFLLARQENVANNGSMELRLSSADLTASENEVTAREQVMTEITDWAFALLAKRGPQCFRSPVDIAQRDWARSVAREIAVEMVQSELAGETNSIGNLLRQAAAMQ